MTSGTASTWIKRLGAALAFGAVLALAGCGPASPDFKGTDITGTHLGKDLALTDHDGKPRTLASFSDKVTVVFFGFTQCPDVCPTALADMAEVMRRLGDDADRVQVLMVTVDPQRDTPEILRAYTTAFDPRFLGLHGDEAALKKTAASFRAYYARASQTAGSDPSRYNVDHTASFYIIDKQGEARVLAGNTAGPDSLAHDIRALL